MSWRRVKLTQNACGTRTRLQGTEGSALLPAAEASSGAIGEWWSPGIGLGAAGKDRHQQKSINDRVQD